MNTIAIALGIALTVFSQAMPAQTAPNLAGHYAGDMIRDGQSLKISIDLAASSFSQHRPIYVCPMHPRVTSSTPDKCPICGMDLVRQPRESGLRATFTSLTQMVMDYPFDSFTVEGRKVHFVLGESIVFDGTATSHHLDGHFTGSQGAGTFHLQLAPPTILPSSIRDVTFHNGTVALSGSLIVPHTPGKHRAVVLLGGSGPQTRWGTLRFLANRFARQGIVALIYDKRGSGRSGGSLDSFTYDDLAGDALAGVRMLASQPEVDRHRIGLLGHSEGGITAVVAAALGPREIAFIIAEDTVAGLVYEQDLYRVNNAIRQAGFKPEEIDQAMSVYRHFLAVARGLKPYAELEADKSRYGSSEWFQWLAIPPRDAALWKTVPQRENLDTLVFWRKVKVPVLLIYGEKDEVAPVDQSIHRIEDALEGHAPFTAIIVPRAQHNLTVHPEPEDQFFWWKGAPGIVDLAASWARTQSILENRLRDDWR